MKTGQDAEQLVRARVLRASRAAQGRRTIPCAAALRLGRALGVSAAAIGRACDAQDIRISRCQLGCFR
jgi:hypothetical protein